MTDAERLPVLNWNGSINCPSSFDYNCNIWIFGNVSVKCETYSSLCVQTQNKVSYGERCQLLQSRMSPSTTTSSSSSIRFRFHVKIVKPYSKSISNTLSQHPAHPQIKSPKRKKEGFWLTLKPHGPLRLHKVGTYFM